MTLIVTEVCRSRSCGVNCEKRVIHTYLVLCLVLILTLIVSPFVSAWSASTYPLYQMTHRHSLISSTRLFVKRLPINGKGRYLGVVGTPVPPLTVQSNKNIFNSFPVLHISSARLYSSSITDVVTFSTVVGSKEGDLGEEAVDRTLCIDNKNAPKASKPRKQNTITFPSPREIKPFVAISFYQFHPLNPKEIKSLVDSVKLQIVSLSDEIKGTLLIAKEGINGAFCIPQDMLSAFQSCLSNVHPVLFKQLEINIGDSFEMAIDDKKFPFKKLKIREKKVVLTDKIGETLNWNDAGPELSPQEWHEEIQQRLILEQPPTELSVATGASTASTLSAEDIEAMKLPPLLLDCRNDYESDMGTFAKATPLNTTSFSETWDALEDMLATENPHRRVLTFCTGGIRCVKVNAYLKQKMGFQNIGRLKHGIIAYEKWLQESAQSHQEDEETEEDIQEVEESTKMNLFEGQNFLFDRRRLLEEQQPATQQQS